MRQASLAERPATQSPAPGTSGKGQLHRVRGFAFQASAESKFFRRKSQKVTFGTAQQAFASAIDQPQLRTVVEREDGEVNLLHHGSQQGSGFQRAKALLPQGFTEGIDFDHHFAHGIVASRPATAKRKIFFPHGGQEIRKCLQRKDNPMPHRESKAEPERKDEKGEGPDSAGRIISMPQENHGNQRTWATRR